MPKDLELPMNFETEDAEREFWATHDSTEYIDWDEADLIHLADFREPILQADDALFQLSGVIDTENGNYTEVRDELFADLTLDDIVAEIKREKVRSTEV
jgi:hypothetical protein